MTTAVNCSLMPLVADDRPEDEERRSAQCDFLQHHSRERSVTPPIRRVDPLARDTPSEHRDPHDQQVKEDRKRPAEYVGLPRDVCSDPATHQGDRKSGQPLPTGERRDLCANYHSNTVATDPLGFPGEAAARPGERGSPAGDVGLPCSAEAPMSSSPAFGLPNSFSPVSPSRWRSHGQTRHHRLPDGASHRPVHVGVSMQCVACACRSWITRQHPTYSVTKALASGWPG